MVRFRQPPAIPGGYRNDNRENMCGIFFQDDWKARPNLTLSAGLRYSYFGPLTDKDNNMGVLTFGSGSRPLDRDHHSHGNRRLERAKAQLWPADRLQLESDLTPTVRWFSAAATA